MPNRFTIVANAHAFAAERHATHKRKYNGMPYLGHLERVAGTVAAAGADPEVVAAALLHDVVEDTPTTNEEVRAKFGNRVAELVAWLTKVPLEAGNRAKRKELDRARLAAAPPEVHTIKLADVMDNTPDIATLAPKPFARLWLAETRALLGVLTKGNRELTAKAWKTFLDYE